LAHVGSIEPPTDPAELAAKHLPRKSFKSIRRQRYEFITRRNVPVAKPSEAISYPHAFSRFWHRSVPDPSFLLTGRHDYPALFEKIEGKNANVSGLEAEFRREI
jgi:hypothetical protein